MLKRYMRQLSAQASGATSVRAADKLIMLSVKNETMPGFHGDGHGL
jgi:hypothetical protein